MAFEKDSDSIISQPQTPRRFRNLVLGLRVLALSVTTAGIVVSAIPTPRSPIAIGILGPAVSHIIPDYFLTNKLVYYDVFLVIHRVSVLCDQISPNYSPIVQFRHRLLHRPWIGGLPCVVWSIPALVGVERCSFRRLRWAFGYRYIVQSGPGARMCINVSSLPLTDKRLAY